MGIQQKTPDNVDFGYETIPRGEKTARVREVFDNVAPSYDLMNDVMSLGIHRYWKDRLMGLINPAGHEHLVDIAGGTGDIAARFLDWGGGNTKGNNDSRATIIDINTGMMAAGRQRRDLRGREGLSWVAGNAEALPLVDGCADIVTIAFGLRNVTDRDAALAEAWRVLKDGGRFYCLEFSHVRPGPVAFAYDLWSEFLPAMGEAIARDRAAYRYLVESIRRFPDQETLSAMLAATGFARIRCIDLSFGIAAIHSGVRLAGEAGG